jgi:glycosyltransferase involved in cell wall biosynthesis
LYYQLHRYGKKVFIAGDIQVNHERRLCHSRKWRIEHWKQELRRRLPCLLPTEEEGGRHKRPKLSVCMATYNGERFIVAQLESILSQLGPDDEVIIVDDASTDRTRDLICGFRDKRIRVIVRETNRGVVSSFEEALENASGDILFLSDQDDLWAPEKVSKVSKCFLDHPEVKIVTTRMQVIDEMGCNLEDDTYCRARAFTPAFLPNLLTNRFQGSTMAFRASLIPEILPFPTAFYVFHDVWIGVRNTLTGGKTHYIDEPLLLYRRHSGNASYRLSRYLQCKKRLHLLIALGLRGLSDTFRWHS